MKKRLLLSACALVLCLSHASADEMTIGDITVPQGGTADLTVGYNFTSTTDKVGFTFSINLPEGLSYVKDESGDPVYVKDETSISKMNIICVGEGNFAGQPANASATIKGTSGQLLTLTLAADASLAVGSTYTAQVTKATFQERVDGSVKDINIDDFTFTITIGEPADTRTVLDENSTTVPAAASGVDVRVKRTIVANQWGTICLPFSMSETQMKEAFGDDVDVELADFSGIETTLAADNAVTGIKVKFNSVSAIEANHPYIIRVSKPISEFTVEGVDITPEEMPSVDRDEKTVKVGKNTYVSYNSFIGTYVADTTVPELTLFLNGGMFWYSSGQTKMKGYRAYFDFYDVLTEVEEAGVKILVSIDGTETGVEEISEANHQGNVYDLSGRKVAKPGSRGIYIIDGKKKLF
ncbi:MAG: hypothetical protein IJ615_00135 [Bacteroidaceae bacterium]|nr:hypothetical protein [Bacteroidaceae bacterium]